jgi:hypothetical protein
MRTREAATVRILRELTLSRAERRAARAERQAEESIRRERDNTRSAEPRAAAVEAERRRYSGFDGGCGL